MTDPEAHGLVSAAAPAPTAPTTVAAGPQAWLMLLDAVTSGKARVTISAPSGQRVVMVSETELEALEEAAALARTCDVVLTLREREVLQLTATGASARQVAKQLGVAVGTVVQHLAGARRKYGVSSSAEAAARARHASALM